MSVWQTQMIDTARGTFEVFVKGEGAPLCVTHLYSVFNESGDRFANMFTEQHRVYLVNLKATGRSPQVQNDEELSMPETVKDLEAIRESLGLPSWSFAGHSTGGMLGAVYAVQAGASLDRVVIVGAAAKRYSESPDCIYNEQHPQYQRMSELLNLLDSDLTPEDRKRYTKERAQLSLYRPEKHDEYFAAPISKGFAGHRLDYFGREYKTWNLYEQLPSVTTQTLILCGRHDVQCPLVYSEDMHRLIPGSQLVVFDESNHYPFLEEADKFRQAVDQFFKESQI